MPTVLLVSASLSLLLAADPDAEGSDRPAGQPDRSRKDVLQLMILHLLKKLPEGDLVALYEFSARDIQCTVAFTDDHSAIRRRIYQMGVHERGLFGPAVEKLTDDLAYNFPLRTKVQVVLFSDGPLSLGWDQCRFRPVDDDAQALDSTCALVQKIQDRYALHLNIVCLGDRHEMPIIRDRYDRLAKAGCGEICYVELPGSNVKRHIDDFFDRIFPTYMGSIQLGSEVLLTFRADPDPHSVAWDPGLYLPPVLAVVGFLPSDHAAYAVISRHSLYDAGAPDSFRRLTVALRHINRVAIIRLDRSRRWFAVLRRIAPASLVLDVLESGAVLPRLQSDLSVCDFASLLESTRAPDPSYLKAAKDSQSLNPDSIQRDVSKLVKLLQEANDDPSTVIALIDDLRRRADRFHCRSLVHALVAVLNSERAHLRPDVQARFLDPALARLHHKPS